MDLGMLALSDRFALSGILCLAAIPCLFIAGLAYNKGPVIGSGICFVLFLVSLFAGTSLGDLDASVSDRSGYITNKSQTKWIKRSEQNINDQHCIFSIYEGRDSTKKTRTVFIPAEELKVVNGRKVMKETGESAAEDDYYVWDEPFSGCNVSSEYGGGGIPQWVYHPAAPVWIFGFFSLPVMGIGVAVNKKLS